jgi:hypothetical protein
MSTINQPQLITQRLALGMSIQTIALHHGVSETHVRDSIVDTCNTLDIPGVTKEELAKRFSQDDNELLVRLCSTPITKDQEINNLKIKITSLEDRVNLLERSLTHLVNNQVSPLLPQPLPRNASSGSDGGYWQNQGENLNSMFPSRNVALGLSQTGDRHSTY